MTSGVPCVVTDVGDAAVLVGDTGLVVPPRSPDAMAAAWRALLRDRSASKIRGDKARARIMCHFSLAQVARRYESLYSQLEADG
jgi:glycosyltransferase involved in cell wall biosynthesis